MVTFTISQSLEKLLSTTGQSLYAYNGESVGMDLYCMSATPISIYDTSKNTLIPTGVRVNLPPNVMGLVLERSSISKTPLKLRAGVIDPGYTGEIFVSCLSVVSGIDYIIEPGTKLPFQLVFIPVLSPTLVTNEIYEESVVLAKRKEGMIGSSDKGAN